MINKYNETIDIGKEHRVFGSAGAGKTTYLLNIIKDVYDQGQQNDMLLVSFTRTAARELIDRTEQMLKKKAEAAGEYYDEFSDDARPNIGTLHAVAWRALGKLPIAETKLASWNEAFPHLRMGSASAVNVDDLDEMPTSSDAPGAKLLAELNLLRSRMVPSELYPENIRQFKDKWSDWKRETGCIDFVDMIYRAYRDIAYAPNRPKIFIADEVQDMSHIQMALFRKWAKHSEYNIIAGDDDQCLYGFTGADPDAFLNPPLPPEQVTILPKSYRLPKRILEFSKKWVEKISVRQPKNIVGTDLEGQVLVAPPNFHINNPEAVIKTVEHYIAQDKTIMILASCSYQLNNIRAALKQSNIAFHNPYRLQRGEFNPLRQSRVLHGILAFLAYSQKYNKDNFRPWNTFDVAAWASLLKVKDGLVRQGASKVLKQWSESDYAMDINSYEVLEQVFDEDTVHELIMNPPEIEWLYNQMTTACAKTAEYPIGIIKKYGVGAVIDKPKVILGTIHSVKGGQTQVTVVFPDLSYKGAVEWNSSEKRKDAIRRVFYVGATRSTETLILGAASSTLAINWSR